MNDINIQKVLTLDTDPLNHLVEESINEGYRHLKRLVDDFETGVNTFNKQGEALFVAVKDGQIAGVCGLNQDPFSISLNVGRVRRMYVSPAVRRSGVGRMLVNSVIAEARKNYMALVLRTDNPVADFFYRSCGFSVSLHEDHHTHILQLSFD